MMPEEKNQIASAGQRRNRCWKNRIVYALAMAGLSSVFCCAVLAHRLCRQEARLAEVTARLEELTRISAEQQIKLEQWMEENTADGLEETVSVQGEAENMEAGSPLEETEQPKAGEEAERTAEHKVYLTFDDGPGKYTEEILDILDQYQVKATFFVVGKEGERAEELMRAIVEGGHTLGMHSYSHDYSEIYRSVEDFAADFERLQDYIYEVTGVKSTVYRFPGGSSNTISDIPMQEFAGYLETRGVEFYDWNISAGDGGSIVPDVETLVENCTADIPRRGTSIILMHHKSSTLEALPVIIENILAMEDTVILPITDATEPVQHIDVTVQP